MKIKTSLSQLVALAMLTTLPGLAAAGVYEDMLIALKSDNTPAAVALLDRGVDVNTVDIHGNTLVMLAVRENNLDLLEQLLLRRARLNIRNRDGDTALRTAAFTGKLPFVQRLVEAGAEVNMYGWSPLAYAAFNGHADVAAYLLKRGAEINAVTENGSTALLLAVRNGHQAAVDILLKHEADPNIATERDETALDWAVKTNNTDIAERLRKAGGRSGKMGTAEPSR
ncbi:MAG: ankyrin repeat domain-containing protein [Rhodocyclaceae bacterium]